MEIGSSTNPNTPERSERENVFLALLSTIEHWFLMAKEADRQNPNYKHVILGGGLVTGQPFARYAKARNFEASLREHIEPTIEIVIPVDKLDPNNCRSVLLDKDTGAVFYVRNAQAQRNDYLEVTYDNFEVLDEPLQDSPDSYYWIINDGEIVPLRRTRGQ